MWTWVRGTAIVQHKARNASVGARPADRDAEEVARRRALPGTAVFLTSDPEVAPSALMHNLKHNNVLHARNVIVTVNVATTPQCPTASGSPSSSSPTTSAGSR